MAIGHLSVKVGKPGKAGPHAAYIAREGRYADRLDKGERLEAKEAGNMPAWAQINPLGVLASRRPARTRQRHHLPGI